MLEANYPYAPAKKKPSYDDLEEMNCILTQAKFDVLKGNILPVDTAGLSRNQLIQIIVVCIHAILEKKP